MSESLLRVEALSSGYGSVTVLRAVDLEVRPGEVTCLLGRNGVGKSSFLKSVMGLLPLQSGRVHYAGKDLTSAPPHQRARAGLGYVPQGREILPQLNVEENLRLGAFAAGTGSAPLPDEVFVYFPDLRRMLRRKGGNLSGGQQQQLAIARALVGRPRLLILDEPTEGIQPNLVQLIRSVVKALNREQGLSVLLVEQKIGFARDIGHAYTILDRGAVAAQGRMEDLDDATIHTHLEVS